MVERSSNCLLDGLCEIIIRVQILVPLSYTGRPFEPLLLAIDQNPSPPAWVTMIARQFRWGGVLLNCNEGLQR